MGRRILLAILVLGLIFVGAQAKDYKERIGPFEASFNLSDETASNTKVNKTIGSGETLDGTPYVSYIIDLQIPETGRTWGALWIDHFNKTYEIDLDKSIEIAEGIGEGYGQTCVSARRIIDGHEGVITNCFGSKLYHNDYDFRYQLDNRTTVRGRLYLDWDTDVLPFLKSLHVEKIE